MEVSLERSEGLERHLKVSVPATTVETEVSNRLKSLAGKVKMAGFRPGKVPFDLVQKQYGGSVRQEVIGEVTRNTLYTALQQEKLIPAGEPRVEITKATNGEPLEYLAKFEVFPEIKLKSFEGVEIEKTVVDITDKDFETMLGRLQELHADKVPVDRASKDKDVLVIDFEGTLDGEPMPSGTANDVEVKLGSKRMIEGFEEGLVGAKKGDVVNLDLSFPEDYQQKDVAGKPVQFKVTVKSV